MMIRSTASTIAPRRRRRRRRGQEDFLLHRAVPELGRKQRRSAIGETFFDEWHRLHGLSLASHAGPSLEPMIGFLAAQFRP